MKRLTALVLIFALLLCGCGAKNAMGFSTVVKFSDMEYVRPDMDAVAQCALEAVEAAEEAKSVENVQEKFRSVENVLEAVWDYYDCYNHYMTQYDLAYIHYQANLTDIYWEDEYNFCAENLTQLDVYLEDIYMAIAECPLRSQLESEYFGEGYFEAYDGGSFYNEELMDLMTREQELIGEYYELSAESQETEYYSEEYFESWTGPLSQLLAELIAVRQELALAAGYDSYPEFAWDFYYYRDYTFDQVQTYLTDIQAKLSPIYRDLDGYPIFAVGDEGCSEKEVFDYVRTAAKEMGGVTWEAFRLLDQGELYDLSASATKSGISFETFLPDYMEPYVFISGTGTRYDCLTFAHEFGHFATDYAACGSVAGTDVLEVFSQGMEYLSLGYAGATEELTRMKLADSLCTYVEQAAFADFEHQMYELTGEDLTGENLLALYSQVLTDYSCVGDSWDHRDMITLPHIYSNPMYLISYVVSNDAAMQLYQMELTTPGAGRDAFAESLATEESWFLAFLEEAGLESPFDRVDEVQKLMEETFS